MSFTKLPREIRDQVYELCFLVDGHITPYPESCAYDKSLDYKSMDYESYKQYLTLYILTNSPTGDKVSSHIALLRVSKSISGEAAAVLYGVRIIRISYLFYRRLVIQVMHHQSRVLLIPAACLTLSLIP